MPKLRTTRVKRKDRTLHVQVMSTRIVWFEFLTFCGRLSRFALSMAIVVALAWAGYLGVRRGFVDNQEFRLRTIDLNANPALDAQRLVRVTGIELDSGIFQLKPDEIRKRLMVLPELSAAEVSRQLPGTLIARVTAREPIAWLACPAANLTGERRAGNRVVDREGAVFPCPQGWMTQAASLPVFVLPNDESLNSGGTLKLPEFEHLRDFLMAVRAEDPALLEAIDRIEQTKSWAIEAKLNDGIQATFGLGDFERQVQDLIAARAHAEQHNQQIATINLIPQRNIPVTLREEATRQPVADEDKSNANNAKDTKETKTAKASEAKPQIAKPSKNTKAAQPARSATPSGKSKATKSGKSTGAAKSNKTSGDRKSTKSDSAIRAKPKAAEKSPSPQTSSQDRRSRDVNSLLNRN